MLDMLLIFNAVARGEIIFIRAALLYFLFCFDTFIRSGWVIHT